MHVPTFFNVNCSVVLRQRMNVECLVTGVLDQRAMSHAESRSFARTCNDRSYIGKNTCARAHGHRTVYTRCYVHACLCVYVLM